MPAIELIVLQKIQSCCFSHGSRRQLYHPVFASISTRSGEST